mmetsp:Transcript_24941/g.34370  ORF Transcript_24941/g.34370 Transcript_24941/m.34370 type:complete len:368 (-) Transcript_24941:31-1134(-)
MSSNRQKIIYDSRSSQTRRLSKIKTRERSDSICSYASDRRENHGPETPRLDSTVMPGKKLPREEPSEFLLSIMGMLAKISPKSLVDEQSAGSNFNHPNCFNLLTTSELLFSVGMVPFIGLFAGIVLHLPLKYCYATNNLFNCAIFVLPSMSTVFGRQLFLSWTCDIKETGFLDFVACAMSVIVNHAVGGISLYVSGIHSSSGLGYFLSCSLYVFVTSTCNELASFLVSSQMKKNSESRILNISGYTVFFLVPHVLLGTFWPSTFKFATGVHIGWNLDNALHLSVYLLLTSYLALVWSESKATLPHTSDRTLGSAFFLLVYISLEFIWPVGEESIVAAIREMLVYGSFASIAFCASGWMYIDFNRFSL